MRLYPRGRRVYREGKVERRQRFRIAQEPVLLGNSHESPVERLVRCLVAEHARRNLIEQREICGFVFICGGFSVAGLETV